MKNYYILFFLLAYGFNVESHIINIEIVNIEQLCDKVKKIFYEKDNGIRLNATEKLALDDFFNDFTEKTVEQFELTRDSVESHKEHKTHETILRDQFQQSAKNYNISGEIKKELEQNLENIIIKKIEGDEYEITKLTYLINDHRIPLSLVAFFVSFSCFAYLYKKYVGVPFFLQNLVKKH